MTQGACCVSLYLFIVCFKAKYTITNQSNTSIKTEQQQETEPPVDSSGFPSNYIVLQIISIEVLRLPERVILLHWGQIFHTQCSIEQVFICLLMEQCRHEKVQIRYGDLYIPFDVEETSLERSILIEGLDISNDLSKIVWKQSLDRYPRPNKISNTVDRYIFGEVSIDVSGGNGFYTGRARFSESEIDISVSAGQMD